MLIKEKLFILKKSRYGDADLILQALTSKGARLSLFARSALKSRKRFGGGVLEPTHFVLAMYDDRRSRVSGGGLLSLREATLIEDFEGLRSDYARLEAGLRFVQLISDVSREGDVGSGELYNLLGNALRAAETTKSLDRLRVHFEARVLAAQGVLSHEPEESELLRAPIARHEAAPLSDDGWRAVSRRVHATMREYLSHLPERS